MEDGAILYDPAADPDLRPEIKAPVFVWSETIADDRTGYSLTEDMQSPLKLPGFESRLTVWKLRRWKDNKPCVYILTQPCREKGFGFPGSREAVEIVHAHEDGFFPFRDSLYPADFSVERVVAMMDIHGLKEGRKGYLYLDNRLAYRERNVELQRARDRSPYRAPNFEHNSMLLGELDIFFPNPGSAVYNPQTMTATATDGATLYSDNKLWKLGGDVSGVSSRIHATWSDRSGLNKVDIVMLPERTYREGYGETRAVLLVLMENANGRARHDSPRNEVPAFPPGKSLAELINMSVPIAGPHAGHMVVVDCRTYEDGWR